MDSGFVEGAARLQLRAHDQRCNARGGAHDPRTRSTRIVYLVASSTAPRQVGDMASSASLAMLACSTAELACTPTCARHTATAQFKEVTRFSPATCSVRRRYNSDGRFDGGQLSATKGGRIFSLQLCWYAGGTPPERGFVDPSPHRRRLLTLIADDEILLLSSRFIRAPPASR